MIETPLPWKSRGGVFALGVPLVVGLVVLGPAWLFAGVFGAALLGAMGEVRNLAARRGSPWLALLGIAVVAVLGVPVIGIRALLGPGWLVLLLVVSWGGDTGAFLVGRSFGRVPLAPRISPRKTVEGAVASLVVGVALASLVREWLVPELPVERLLVVAVGGNVLSQAGDLLESAYKRACGAKDSGLALGDQGGILDSLDGTLLAAPWVLGVGFAGS